MTRMNSRDGCRDDRTAALSVVLSWNSMGPTQTPTPTRTLGMGLSCNFVNGYTIAYRVQYTFTRDILARKSARVGQVGGQVGEDSRVEVGEDVGVRVRVRVGVGPMEFKLYWTASHAPGGVSRCDPLPRMLRAAWSVCL